MDHERSPRNAPQNELRQPLRSPRLFWVVPGGGLSYVRRSGGASRTTSSYYCRRGARASFCFFFAPSCNRVVGALFRRPYGTGDSCAAFLRLWRTFLRPGCRDYAVVWLFQSNRAKTSIGKSAVCARPQAKLSFFARVMDERRLIESYYLWVCVILAALWPTRLALRSCTSGRLPRPARSTPERLPGDNKD